ncbi:MAG: pyridoxal phosphate-dependent aminotransferase family protein [Candidatus Brocadiia bacterium]
MESSNSKCKTGRLASILSKAYGYKEAEAIRRTGFYPYFREIESEQDTEVIIDGRKVLMLGSNSYLGLTNDPRVKEAAIEATRKYGTGCAGSRFLNGTLDIHRILEEELAAFVGKEAALLFSTGYMANQGVIGPLVSRADYIVTDKLVHASIIEGAVLAPGQMIRYEHNDMEHLEEVMAELPLEAGKLIAVDGVFSMDGDIANLPAIVEIAEKYNGAVMVDDAHSIGVLGPCGDGTAAHFGLTSRVDIIMGTFSKSLAAVGGFIAGTHELIDFLKHHSRALIFSASPPPASVGAVLAALKIVREEPERRAKLWDNTRRMQQGLRKMRFDIGKTETPVIPLHVGDRQKAFMMCLRLQQEGIFVNPVVPPAVRPKESLIRISLMATHTHGQIDFALNAIGKVGREIEIIP